MAVVINTNVDALKIQKVQAIKNFTTFLFFYQANVKNPCNL